VHLIERWYFFTMVPGRFTHTFICLHARTEITTRESGVTTRLMQCRAYGKSGARRNEGEHASNTSRNIAAIEVILVDPACG